MYPIIQHYTVYPIGPLIYSINDKIKNIPTVVGFASWFSFRLPVLSLDVQIWRRAEEKDESTVGGAAK